MKNLNLTALALLLILTGCMSLTKPEESDGDADADADEDSETCVFYRDSDSDGFGDPESRIEALCEEILSYVEIGGDCNDTDSGVNPDAQEVCDEVDNNCDGETDEGSSLCDLPNAESACVEGECVVTSCHEDFWDNDLEDPGCEYECIPTGIEICTDAFDSDCDEDLNGGYCDEIGFLYEGNLRSDGGDMILEDENGLNPALSYGITSTAGIMSFADGAYADCMHLDSEFLDVPDFTVMFWMRTEELLSGRKRIILGRGRACCPGESSWEIFLAHGGEIGVQWTTDGTGVTGDYLVSSVPLSPTWTHIAITFAEGVVEIYQNAIHTDHHVGEDPYISSRPIRIGSGWCEEGDPNSTSFTGDLAEVVFYATAISGIKIERTYRITSGSYL